MTKLTSFARSLAKDDNGATMIEYSLLVGLISVAIIVSIGLISTDLKTIWTAVEKAMDCAAGTAASCTTG